MSGHPQGAQYDDGYGHGQQGQNAYYHDDQYGGQYHDDQRGGYQDNQQGDAYYDESAYYDGQHGQYQQNGYYDDRGQQGYQDEYYDNQYYDQGGAPGSYGQDGYGWVSSRAPPPCRVLTGLQSTAQTPRARF
jgi:1,3-beta-glucan synthase